MQNRLIRNKKSFFHGPIYFKVLKLRFPEDLRVQSIVECLQSSVPVLIDIPQKPNMSEQDAIEAKEKYLACVAQRTMSLPFGR